MKKQLPWFRFYTEALDDPKVQRLPDHLFKTWVNLLCVANQNGGKIPPIDDVAFMTRVSAHEMKQRLDDLILCGLIDIMPGGGCEPHNWHKRQFRTDNSYERVAKYRDKRKKSGLPVLSDYTKFKPALYERDGKSCVYCLKAKPKLVVDHMIPISAGGTDDIDNLALACRECNAGKSGRTPDQAGMAVLVGTAVTALSRYSLRHVTVTVTAPETDTDSEAEAEAQKEKKEDKKTAHFTSEYDAEARSGQFENMILKRRTTTEEPS